LTITSFYVLKVAAVGEGFFFIFSSYSNYLEGGGGWLLFFEE
jgi:hypothetical protein